MGSNKNKITIKRFFELLENDYKILSKEVTTKLIQSVLKVSEEAFIVGQNSSKK